MVTKGHKTTYALVNLTALCIIFSGGKNNARGRQIYRYINSYYPCFFYSVPVPLIRLQKSFKYGFDFVELFISKVRKFSTVALGVL